MNHITANEHVQSDIYGGTYDLGPIYSLTDYAVESEREHKVGANGLAHYELSLNINSNAVIDITDKDVVKKHSSLWKFTPIDNLTAPKHLRGHVHSMADKLLVDVIMHPRIGKWGYVDGNPLNPIRDNLKPLVLSSNASTLEASKTLQYTPRVRSHSYVGVVEDTKSHTFSAILKMNGKTYDLGTHDTSHDAANVYNIAAKKLLGYDYNVNEITDKRYVLSETQTRVISSMLDRLMIA